MSYHGGMGRTASEAEKQVRDLEELLYDIEGVPTDELCDSDFGHSPEWKDIRQGIRNGNNVSYSGN